MSKSDKSGKPELTAEDKKRYRNLAVDLAEGDNYNSFTMEAMMEMAEYAALHERSAAQARIAELEAALEEIADYVDPHSPYNSGYIMKEIAKSVLKP